MRFALILSLALIVIVLICTKHKLNNDKYHDIELANSLEKVNDNVDDSQDDVCVVDIKGAINNPGVYNTKCTDNVNDVIRLAGGLTDEADTSVTNLAKKIVNEMVIIIYTREEVKNSNVVDTVVKVIDQECVCPNVKNDGCINDEVDNTIGGDNKLININTASLDELKTIPGIGESKAKAIIDYRTKNGNFKSIDDIQNVSGIGSKLYEAIKTYITT